MTRYLLDTNVVSEAVRPIPSSRLADWFADQDDNDLFTTSLTIGELWRGILQLPDGRRRRHLEGWFSGPEGPLRLFDNRILAFDNPAALLWARLMADGTKAGRPRSASDMMIAAVAEVNECIVVSYNDRHFHPAVQVLNPDRL